MWSKSTMLVVFECVFKVGKLPVHASSPCRVCANISEPLASLADVVLVDKPLVSLINLPSVFKLRFWRFWYVMEYMLM